MLACPSLSCTVRKSAPTSRVSTAEVWRKRCKWGRGTPARSQRGRCPSGRAAWRYRARQRPYRPLPAQLDADGHAVAHQADVYVEIGGGRAVGRGRQKPCHKSDPSTLFLCESQKRLPQQTGKARIRTYQWGAAWSHLKPTSRTSSLLLIACSAA